MRDRWVMAASKIVHRIEERLPSTWPRTHYQREEAQGRRNRKRPRLSVQAKITGPYILLSLALALAGAFVATRIIFDTTRERFTNQLIETRKLASLWVTHEEELLLDALRLLANTNGVGEGIQAGSSELLRELVFPLVLNEGLEAIEVVNLKGVSILAMRHVSGGRIEDYESSKGDTEYLAWPIVSRVLQGNSDSSGDKFAAIVQASWGKYLYISGPVFDEQGDLAGVILVGERLSTVGQKMRESTAGQITVYDLNGDLLETTLMLEPDPIGSGESSSIMLRQDTQTLTRTHSLADIVYEEVLGPLELRGGQDVAILGTALPQSFLVNANAVTRVQVYSFSAAGLLLIILLGLGIARAFTRPLHQLTRATSKVAEGDLDVQVSVDGDDEIAALAESFNSMMNSIRTSECQLIEAHNEVVNAYDLTIWGWARALELRNKETEGHSRRVTDMTLRLANALGVDVNELVHVKRGALLHDIGKMGVPDTILLKQGPLTEDEWAEMRKHPLYSYEMLRGIGYLRPAIDIPYAHHEKWDGTGYPRGLKGEEIPLAARIFAVVDVWDALSSDRPYREALPQWDVITQLASLRGTHFDPKVLDRFLDVLLDRADSDPGASMGTQSLEDQGQEPSITEREAGPQQAQKATQPQP